MPLTIDKHLVMQRFRKCLGTYDAQATVQRSMAERLVTRLQADCGTSCSRAMEAGSGTGLLTRLLLQKMHLSALWTNDLVADCRRNSETLANEFPQTVVRFVEGDIETATGLPSDLDLIASNATFQWVLDLPGLLERLSALLAPGGVLAFTTFGPDNLAEVRCATGTTLHYHDTKTLRTMLPAGMTVLSIEETRVTLTFASPRDVLDHMRSTGSNALARKTWTRGSLVQFESNYRSAEQSEGGISLTYHPIFVVAKRTGGEP